MKKLILMLLMAVCCLMTAHAQKTVVSQTNQKVFDTLNQQDAGFVNFGDPQFVKYLIENYG